MFGFRFGKKRTDAVSGFLGSQTEFSGKLSFSGIVHLDGRFEGEIVSRGVLVVGSESVIQANIHSHVLRVAGEVRGDLTATEKIELHSPAKVYGSIRTPRLVVEEGVVFEGTCRMSAVVDETPAFAEPRREPEENGEEEPLEVISAQPWPPSYDDTGEDDLPMGGSAPKHDR